MTTPALERLRAGHAWLEAAFATLLPDEEGRFLRALDVWDRLESHVRQAGHTGCVMTSGMCPEGSPVACRDCGMLRATALTPQDVAPEQIGLW